MMIPEKYQNDYKGYIALIELGGDNINVNLQTYYKNLKVKYGDRFAEMLWDKFIREYGNN